MGRDRQLDRKEVGGWAVGEMIGSVKTEFCLASEAKADSESKVELVRQPRCEPCPISDDL